jgi:hypothetical protein
METPSAPTAPVIFADGIKEAHVANGVVRLSLAMLGPDGKPAASGMLVLPLTQLTGFANGVVALTRQVEAKVREAQAAQKPDAGQGEAGFRLGS